MSNLGHIHGNIRQIRAKSRGAEACHCTKIIHVLITLPVCLWMSSALCYFCLSGSPLCDPVCLTQYESLIVRKRPTTSAKTFSILIPTPIPHCPDNAYTSVQVMELQSLMSLVGLFITQAGIMLLNYLLFEYSD